MCRNRRGHFYYTTFLTPEQKAAALQQLKTMSHDR